MLYLLTIGAFILTAVFSNQQPLLAGNVSPSTPATSSSQSDLSSDGDANGTGEVDEDVIITEEEDNDDEGVTS